MKLSTFLYILPVAFAIPLPENEERTFAELSNNDLYEEGELFQGDIRLPLPPLDRNGIIFPRFLWPDAVVPYEISPNFTSVQRATILKAVSDYSELTGGCVTFTPRQPHHENYVSMSRNNNLGCFSWVGRLGGKQPLNLPDWCSADQGSIMHEMFHALGFFHEQMRTDRDDYVTVHWENIEEGLDPAINFIRLRGYAFDPYGEEYDYTSLMHYDSYAFSKNGEMTIVTKDPDYQDVIGTATKLSASDLRRLFKMYNCPAIH